MSKPKSAIALKILERKKRFQEEQKKRLEKEKERLKAEREAEEEEERQEEKRLSELKAKRQAKKEKILKAKKEGRWLSEKEKLKHQLAKKAREEMLKNTSNSTKMPKTIKIKKKKNLLNEIMSTPLEETQKKEESVQNIKSEDSESSDGNWDDTSLSESDESDQKEDKIDSKENKIDSKENKIDSKENKIDSKENKIDSKENKIDQKSNFKASKNKNSVQDEKPSDFSLRAPICCVLGHVDTGKTKLLDRMRSSSVQDNEVGGITQQIGATFFPHNFLQKAIKPLHSNNPEKAKSTKKTKKAPKKAPPKGKNSSIFRPSECNVPGLLVIDTPGHESFSNLRQRGSSLCDIAVLVVDLMHGVEAQTAESVRLLRKGRTPFVVALNKLDKIFEWKAKEDRPLASAFASQGKSQINEFRRRLNETIAQISALGLNCSLFSENKDPGRNVSLIPTSAITGEGVPDLLGALIGFSQTILSNRLKISAVTKCSILEVRLEPGLGYTIDVILSGGRLKTGDKIVMNGLNGPICTVIRGLYEPKPLKETRFKAEFKMVRTVEAAAGVKICAPQLENAISGSSVLVCGDEDDENELMEEVKKDFSQLLDKLEPDKDGVMVQCSTMGALEAFLEYLQSEKIPVSRVALGPVRKKDVTAASVVVESRPELACILAFNVKADRETKQFAESMNVKIFQGEIIYNLRDMFKEYLLKFKESERKESKQAVIPVTLSILPEFIIMKHNPIILGCKVESGRLVTGTPLVAFKENAFTPNQKQQPFIRIGTVESIEVDKKKVDEVKRGNKAAVKIAQPPELQHVYFGRQFDANSPICSLLSRESIDELKKDFKEILSKDDWKLVIKLKKTFGID